MPLTTSCHCAYRFSGFRDARFLLRKLILDPKDATDAQVRMLQQQLHVAGTTHAVGLWLPGLLGSDERFAIEDATAFNGAVLTFLSQHPIAP